MSLDASYILVYDKHSYSHPLPMDEDKEFLLNEYGGDFQEFDHGFSIYWEKPKYTLPRDEIKNLYADQILERKDGEIWVNIKS